MAKDARVALNQLNAALERRFEAVASGRGADDPAILNAYEHLEEAFLDYEEALNDQFGEFLPMELAEDESGSN
jgi:hypothetical protein